MELINKIKELSINNFEDVRKIRRHLHKYPELSFQEDKTSEYIISCLEELEIPYKNNVAGRGIVGWIEGENPEGHVVALRADMDALPIQEENEIEYRSVNNNCMHACGHDVHTACLIGAARILKKIKSEIRGKVLFVFQPAEELLPGGAKQMLLDSIFNEHKPDIFIGQHVDPELECGTTGFREGVYMASADEIYITIRGVGGHAAMPKHRTNNLLIASKIIIGLNDMLEKSTYLPSSTILAFGKIEAKGTTNIIPQEVMIDGTFRILDEKFRYRFHKDIINKAEQIAREMGAECYVDIKKGYPVLENDKIISAKSSKLAGEYLGKENVKDLDIRMTAEDFSYFSQKYPSVFYRLGTGNAEKNIICGLHNQNFNIDEEALKTGMGLFAYLAVSHCR
ncbi:M20 family metallopeptidase [Bacteroidota bacterium]